MLIYCALCGFRMWNVSIAIFKMKTKTTIHFSLAQFQWQKNNGLTNKCVRFGLFFFHAFKAKRGWFSTWYKSYSFTHQRKISNSVFLVLLCKNCLFRLSWQFRCQVCDFRSLLFANQISNYCNKSAFKYILWREKNGSKRSWIAEI